MTNGEAKAEAKAVGANLRDAYKDIPLAPGDRAYDLVSAVSDGIGQFKNLPMLICWGELDFVFDRLYGDDAPTRRFERLELALRTRDGVPAGTLDPAGLDGLVETRGERVVLTRAGRLLANEIALRLDDR